MKVHTEDGIMKLKKVGSNWKKKDLKMNAKKIMNLNWKKNTDQNHCISLWLSRVSSICFCFICSFVLNFLTANFSHFLLKPLHEFDNPWEIRVRALKEWWMSANERRKKICRRSFYAFKTGTWCRMIRLRFLQRKVRIRWWGLENKTNHV